MELAYFSGTKCALSGIEILNRKILEIIPFDYVHEVRAGMQHIILRSNDKLYSLGSNAFGQAGLKYATGLRALIDPFAQDEDFYEEPEPIEFFNRPARVTNSSDSIAQIACGNFHSVARSEKGKLFNWGANYLGQGRLENCNQPIYISLPDPVQKIQVCGNTTFALTESCRLFLWGCIPGLSKAMDNFLPHWNFCLNVPTELPFLTVRKSQSILNSGTGIVLFECIEDTVSFTSLIPHHLSSSTHQAAVPILPTKHQTVYPESIERVCNKYLKWANCNFANNAWNCKQTISCALYPSTFFMLTTDARVIIFETKIPKATEIDGVYEDIFANNSQLLLLSQDGRQVQSLFQEDNNWKLKNVFTFTEKCYKFALTSNLLIGIIGTKNVKL